MVKHGGLNISEPLSAARFDPAKPSEMKQVEAHLKSTGLFASIKYDGVRCLGVDSNLNSRSMKDIANVFTNQRFERHCKFKALDGELIVGDPTDKQCIEKTSAAMRTIKGEPQSNWYLYDMPSLDPFEVRIDNLNEYVERKRLPHVIVVQQKLLRSWDEVLEMEETHLAQGHEGLILRSPDGRYKSGKSTLKEGYCVKLKRFKDGEAVVIGVTELQHNLNPQKVSETGKLKRAKLKEFLVGGNTLGNLICRDLETGVEFEIGTGFSAAQRQWFWDNRDKVVNKIIVHYRWFPVGVKDRPRHPTFKYIRDPKDMAKPKKGGR